MLFVSIVLTSSVFAQSPGYYTGTSEIGAITVRSNGGNKYIAIYPKISWTNTELCVSGSNPLTAPLIIDVEDTLSKEMYSLILIAKSMGTKVDVFVQGCFTIWNGDQRAKIIQVTIL